MMRRDHATFPLRSSTAVVPLLSVFVMNPGCREGAPDPADADSPMPATPLIIAHRGASADAPENTLAAFALAWERGADGIECDVRLTADGQLVCLHDADTGRTGDGGGEPGTGLVAADHPLAALRGVDAGRWKHDDYAGQTAPTLDAVLAATPGDRHVFIEVKAGVEAVPELLACLDRVGDGRIHVTVISFDADVIRAVKSRRPDLTANWLTSVERDGPLAWRPSHDEILHELQACHADGLGIKAAFAHVDAALVRRLRDAGCGVHLWTVNDPDDARRARTLGIDSITTDRPAFLRTALSPVD